MYNRMNNKGFSLIELIIVMAIMAILVGVVGTQVVPYLDRSRKARDYQVFSGWNTAGVSAYSMNADKVISTEDYSILITNSSVTCEDASLDGSDELIDTFCDLTGLTKNGTDLIKAKMVSRSGNEIEAVRIFIPAQNGTNTPIYTRIYTNATGTTESADFGVIENK